MCRDAVVICVTVSLSVTHVCELQIFFLCCAIMESRFFGLYCKDECEW